MKNIIIKITHLIFQLNKKGKYIIITDILTIIIRVFHHFKLKNKCQKLLKFLIKFVFKSLCD